MVQHLGAGDHESGGIDGVAFRVLTDLAARPGVIRAGLALVEGAGRRLRFTSSDRLGDAAPRWCHVDAFDDVPLTAVVRTGEPVLAAVDDLDLRYATFAEHQRDAGVRSLAAVAVPGSAGPVGGLIVYFDERQPFDERQAGELRAAAQAVATRLDSLRSPGAGRGSSGPAGAGARVATTTVDGDPQAARAARQFLRRELAAWQVDGDLADVAVLCLSELVTNAVMHTGTPSQLEISLDDATLTLVVRDQGGPAHLAPEPDADQDPLRVHGRGLQLVDALARRWGAEHDTVGTTVWVELDRAV
jgi:anti-sigma regulatory factor (Ser/Thr protein kinase)